MGPSMNAHAVVSGRLAVGLCPLGSHPVQILWVIDVEAHRVPESGQLLGQSPAHPQVPVVVNDMTKHIPDPTKEWVVGVRVGLNRNLRLGFQGQSHAWGIGKK